MTYYKRNNNKDIEAGFDALKDECNSNGSSKVNNINDYYNSEEYLDDLKYLGNFYARRLGGIREEFPLKFPKNEFPIEYKHYYFNNEINWNDVIVDDLKIKFLIDADISNKRYIIFRNILGYNENNIDELKNQIVIKSSKYKVFIQKKFDEFGFRVKIYMPIKFANSNEQLILKTCWLISEDEKPKFLTAYYVRDFERDLNDEI